MTLKSLLLISRCPPAPLHLGDRLIIGNIVPYLVAQGVQVDLIALVDTSDADDPAAAFAREVENTAQYQADYRSIALVPESPRTPLHYLIRVLLASRRFPTHAKRAWSSALFERVQTHLATRTVDAVWVFGGIQVYEVAHALANHPTVITPYESYALYLERVQAQSPSLLNRLRGWVARRYERFMFDPYARTVLLAEPDAQTVRAANPSLDVRVIPNGVRLPATSNRAREEATLLFVGNFAYAPNVEAALLLVTTVLPLVQQSLPHAQVWLVGSTPPPALLALASERVTVTGYVDDLLPYYQRATVFVSPLMTGAGMKNKILEALAHRLPVIATSISTDGIAIQHETHALVGDADHLAMLTVRALQDSALRARLAQAGRRLVQEHYSWSSVADQYLALFSELTTDHSQPTTNS